MIRASRLRKRSGSFMSHKWGTRLQDGTYDNHVRVARMCTSLTQRGLVPWFDAERMTGTIVQQMQSGIDDSKCVVTCITMTYIDKVGGKNAADNCQKEFLYADREKTKDLMLAVIMEPACLDKRNWYGPVKFSLGGELYVDLTSDDEWEAKMDDLA